MARFRLASRGLVGLLVGVCSCVSFSSTPYYAPASSLDGGAASQDGGPDDGDAVADGDAARQKLAFILTAKVTGALAKTADAALHAADTLCEREFAQASGRQGFFVAWLVTVASPVLGRFGASRGPWYLPSGERVAQSLDDLAMHGPEVPIDVTAWGKRLAPDPVWTGSKADGSGANTDCQEWISDNSNDYGTYGSYGRPAAGGDWASAGGNRCNELSHLYCFER